MKSFHLLALSQMMGRKDTYPQYLRVNKKTALMKEPPNKTFIFVLSI